MRILLLAVLAALPAYAQVQFTGQVELGNHVSVSGFNQNQLPYCTVLNQTLSGGQISIEYQCENFIYWINQTTGQLTWVQETSGTFGACSTTYAVDSVNGLDSNAGTCASPFKTITKLNTVTFSNGNSVGFAANSHWRGDGFAPNSVTNLTLSAYGTGSRPHIDGNAIIPNANFTLNGGDTFTYQATIASDPFQVGTIGLYENSVRLPYESSIANVESTAGSYYYDPAVCKTLSSTSCTFYVHPVGSTNPISDGNVYEASVYQKGIYSNGGASWTISGLWVGPVQDAAIYTPNILGGYYHDILLLGGSTHSFYTDENDKLVNVWADSPYDNITNGGGGPNPFINYFNPASGTMEFDAVGVVIPNPDVANDGGCVASYGHTPSGTDPTPTLTYTINYAKLINCRNGWQDTDVVTSNYAGFFTGGSTQNAIASSAASQLNVNGLIETGLIAGSNQAINLAFTGMNANLNNLRVVAATSGGGDSYLVNAANPFGSLILTNSFMTGLIEGVRSTSGTASNSLSSNHNVFSNSGRAYDLTTAPTTIQSNYNTFPFSQFGQTGVKLDGTTYLNLPAWQATGQDLNSGPTLLLSAGWGSTAAFGSPYTSNWPSDTGGQFEVIAGGTGLAANATVTYTFAVPYTTLPSVAPTYTGTGSGTWTQSVTTSQIVWTQTAVPLNGHDYFISYVVTP